MDWYVTFWALSAGSICFLISWLRVSGTAEMPQIDQCVRH